MKASASKVFFLGVHLSINVWTANQSIFWTCVDWNIKHISIFIELNIFIANIRLTQLYMNRRPDKHWDSNSDPVSPHCKYMIKYIKTHLKHQITLRITCAMWKSCKQKQKFKENEVKLQVHWERNKSYREKVPSLCLGDQWMNPLLIQWCTRTPEHLLHSLRSSNLHFIKRFWPWLSQTNIFPVPAVQN